MADHILISTCQCGKVQCQGVGRPIVSSVCYCDDCQAGAAMLEALDTYRDDRFDCVKGTNLLRAYQNSPDAPTRRMVASCCNTAMFLKYAKGHWTSSYAKRFQGDVPPIEMRTQMQFRNSSLPLPDDAPSYRTFGFRLFWRLFTSRIAMIFG